LKGPGQRVEPNKKGCQKAALFSSQEPSRVTFLESPRDILAGSGFVHLQLIYVGARARENTLRITTSEEMKQCNVDAEYNRPIDRRLEEEAGGPRGSISDKENGFRSGVRYAAYSVGNVGRFFNRALALKDAINRTVRGKSVSGLTQLPFDGRSHRSEQISSDSRCCRMDMIRCLSLSLIERGRLRGALDWSFHQSGCHFCNVGAILKTQSLERLRSL